MKHFIKITDFTSDEIMCVLDRADELQRLWQTKKMPQTLAGQKIALWFYGNGFRNRVAFEMGARAMGADVTHIPGELGVQEPIQDVGHYLRNWFTMLVIRCRNHEDLERVVESVAIPVINARTTYNHPCEIISDLQYIRQKRSSLEGLNVVFVGEVTNLCRSWFEAATMLPITVTQVAPKGYELNQPRLGELNKNARGLILVSHDLGRTINKKTDVIYTDCWPQIPKAKRIHSKFLKYQVEKYHLSQMNPNGFFLPCPPVTRGQEVSWDAMDSPLCRNYEAKECLLHSQNAIMEFVKI